MVKSYYSKGVARLILGQIQLDQRFGGLFWVKSNYIKESEGLLLVKSYSHKGVGRPILGQIQLDKRISNVFFWPNPVRSRGLEFVPESDPTKLWSLEVKRR